MDPAIHRIKHLVVLLQSGNTYCVQDLVKILSVHEATIYRWIQEFRAQDACGKCVYVHHWGRQPNMTVGQFCAYYSWGNFPDAAVTKTEKTAKDYGRAYTNKKKLLGLKSNEPLNLLFGKGIEP